MNCYQNKDNVHAKNKETITFIQTDNISDKSRENDISTNDYSIGTNVVHLFCFIRSVSFFIIRFTWNHTTIFLYIFFLNHKEKDYHKLYFPYCFNTVIPNQCDCYECSRYQKFRL